MNITVAKSDLEEALKVSSLTVGSSSDLSSHYLFRVSEREVEILSYDMRVFSRTPLRATVEGDDGAFTVEAWRLDKWVSSVADGALSLKLGEGGEVTAKGPRSKIKLRSLDASRFPYWDGLLSEATSIGTLAPAVLYRALNLSKSFVSTDDTSRPEICQTEARSGVLQATNRRAVSSVTVRSLPSLNLRVPGKDLSMVLKFLSDKYTEENDVEVQEASRPAGAGGGACALFLRPDGSYVGISRPTAEMPTLEVNAEDTGVALSLNVDEFNRALDILLASAPKGHEAVEFRAEGEGLVLSMPSAAGGSDSYPMIFSTQTGLGSTVFSLDYSYIKSIADLFGLDMVDLSVHVRQRGGYVSFAHEDEGGAEAKANAYYTVIVWRS
jgi:hypothetical protein